MKQERGRKKKRITQLRHRNQMNKATQNLAAERQAGWRRTSSETFPVGVGSKVKIWWSHDTATVCFNHFLWTGKLTFRHLFISYWSYKGLKGLAKFPFLITINRFVLPLTFVYSKCDIVIYTIHILSVPFSNQEALLQ